MSFPHTHSMSDPLNVLENYTLMSESHTSQCSLPDTHPWTPIQCPMLCIIMSDIFSGPAVPDIILTSLLIHPSPAMHSAHPTAPRPPPPPLHSHSKRHIRANHRSHYINPPPPPPPPSNICSIPPSSATAPSHPRHKPPLCAHPLRLRTAIPALIINTPHHSSSNSAIALPSAQ